MKQNIKKILCVTLTLAILAGVMPATIAQAAVLVKPKYTFYTRPGYSEDYRYIDVEGMKKGEKIIKSSMKISDKSVAKIGFIDNYTHTRQYFDSRKKKNENDQYGIIMLKIKKAGKAKLSFNIGSKTYSTQIICKKYVNPCKTLKIKGVKDGKDLASKFRSSSDYLTKLSETVKKSTVSIKAKAGWRISYVGLYNMSDDSQMSFYPNSDSITSTTLNIGNLEKGIDYMIDIEYTNIKDGGVINQYVNL